MLSRWLPQKDAASACTKVRRPVDSERLDVEGGLLELGGVVSDENERTETDLLAQSQTTVGKHVDEDRKNRNLAESR